MLEDFWSVLAILSRLALDPIRLNHLGHLIETYITDLLVSVSVHIVKFRPKQPEKLGGTLVV